MADVVHVLNYNIVRVCVLPVTIIHWFILKIANLLLAMAVTVCVYVGEGANYLRAHIHWRFRHAHHESKNWLSSRVLGQEERGDGENLEFWREFQRSKK